VLDGSSSMTQQTRDRGILVTADFNTQDHLPVNRSYFQQFASSKRLCLHPPVSTRRHRAQCSLKTNESAFAARAQLPRAHCARYGVRFRIHLDQCTWRIAVVYTVFAAALLAVSSTPASSSAPRGVISCSAWPSSSNPHDVSSLWLCMASSWATRALEGSPTFSPLSDSSSNFLTGCTAHQVSGTYVKRCC
jgi:hypothetical protein